MRRILFTAAFLGLAINLKGEPLLIESYQVGDVSRPPNQYDTTKVVEVEFTLDTTCYVQITTGGLAALAQCWLFLDDIVLPPTSWQASTIHPEGFAITYTYLLTAGLHKIFLGVTDNYNLSDPTTCKNAYLQALIFLPDAAGAVAERPPVDESTSPQTRAVISRGPYVSAPGASTVVDASGRIMENVLSEGKVDISNLPAGTYYAKDKERTVVKIVKVD